MPGGLRGRTPAAGSVERVMIRRLDPKAWGRIGRSPISFRSRRHRSAGVAPRRLPLTATYTLERRASVTDLRACFTDRCREAVRLVVVRGRHDDAGTFPLRRAGSTVRLRCAKPRARAFPRARPPGEMTRRHRLRYRAVTPRSRLADLAFGAVHQSRDVGAVHDPQQHRQQRKSAGSGRVPSIQSANGVAALATSAASDE